MLRIYERCGASALLHLCHGVQGQCCLPTALRTVDLQEAITALTHTPGLEAGVHDVLYRCRLGPYCLGVDCAIKSRSLVLPQLGLECLQCKSVSGTFDWKKNLKRRRYLNDSALWETASQCDIQRQGTTRNDFTAHIQCTSQAGRSTFHLPKIGNQLSSSSQ